ncbi:hypothetical protein KJ596_04270 [Patescibacteria group bacterium]|nr:hypothetical protein [Patescibacteria group bacterium]MBU1868300.1 hypothetical protein [Patescibacteria group bacterium]
MLKKLIRSSPWGKLVLIVLVGAIVVVVVVILLNSRADQGELVDVNIYPEESSVSESVKLYSCSSTASSSLETVSDFIIDLYPIKNVEQGSTTVPVRQDVPPTISLTEFKVSSWPSDDVYYEVFKDGKLYTSFWGVAVSIEVCDENNMTNIPLDDPSDVSLISEELPAAAAGSYIHGGHIPATPGTYRVDGYFFYDGKWHLTNRLEDVVFTE